MNLVFQFQDLQSFWWMDGHGPYVWFCYAVTFLGLTFLAVEPSLKKRRFIKQQKQLLAIKTAQQKNKEEG